MFANKTSVTTVIFNCCPQLTGTLPEYIAKLPLITEFKVEHNELIGTIPAVYGEVKRGLVRFQVEYNHLHGRIPETFG